MALHQLPLSIVFDLDGTLVDTAPDLVRVLNETTALDGLAPVSIARAKKMIGHGSKALITNAFEFNQRLLSQSRADELREYFLKIYAEDIARLSQPFPGTEEVLAQLKRAGHRLSVCTNKPGFMARLLLEKLALTRYFDRIVGYDDTPSPKPSAHHIFAAAGHRRAEDIIMVGDGAPDALAARAAKVPVILMSYGYSPVPVHAFGAEAVLRSFRGIPSALNRIGRQAA